MASYLASNIPRLLKESLDQFKNLQFTTKLLECLKGLNFFKDIIDDQTMVDDCSFLQEILLSSTSIIQADPLGKEISIQVIDLVCRFKPQMLPGLMKNKKIVNRFEQILFKHCLLLQEDPTCHGILNSDLDISVLVRLVRFAATNKNSGSTKLVKAICNHWIEVPFFSKKNQKSFFFNPKRFIKLQ
jgi:hypothetical protein